LHRLVTVTPDQHMIGPQPFGGVHCCGKPAMGSDVTP